MAIDTENKRRSVQAYWPGLAGPVPDGTIGRGDRAATAGFYSGITYTLTAMTVGIAAQFHRLWGLHTHAYKFN